MSNYYESYVEEDDIWKGITLFHNGRFRMKYQENRSPKWPWESSVEETIEGRYQWLQKSLLDQLDALNLSFDENILYEIVSMVHSKSDIKFSATKYMTDKTKGDYWIGKYLEKVILVQSTESFGVISYQISKEMWHEGDDPTYLEECTETIRARIFGDFQFFGLVQDNEIQVFDCINKLQLFEDTWTANVQD